MFSLGILTISTSGHQGRREDTSGQAIRELLASPQYQVRQYEVIPDDRGTIESHLVRWADDEDLELIVTTGGTGLGPQDVTPEACLAVTDRQVPGLAEAMRAQTMKFTSMAMLSRSVAAVRGHTLMVTLPGSEKAVRQCLEVVMPVLPHALEILKDRAQGHPVDS